MIVLPLKNSKHKSTTFFSYDDKKVCFYDILQVKIYTHTNMQHFLHKYTDRNAQSKSLCAAIENFRKLIINETKNLKKKKETKHY